MYDMVVERGWFDPSKYYDEEYSWAVHQEPLVITSIPREELIKLRAKLENSFAIRNYLDFAKNNPRFLLQLVFLCIRYPVNLLRGIARFLKTRKISVFGDNLLRTYRLKFLARKAE
jgi:hypothetical protein